MARDEEPRSDLPATARTRLRRKADRGSYDWQTIAGILDEALVCHVGFGTDTGPVVVPMTYGRVDRHLYLHGAAANHTLRSIVGRQVCVTVTLLDGLVLARSTLHHSMNYRSVMVLGAGEAVEEPDEKRAALDAIVDHVVPGRTKHARPATAAELRATLVVRVPLDEASAKIRTGGPIDDPEDLSLPVWAGVVRLRLSAGAPEADEAGGDLPAPSYVDPYLRPRRASA